MTSSSSSDSGGGSNSKRRRIDWPDTNAISQLRQGWSLLLALSPDMSKLLMSMMWPHDWPYTQDADNVMGTCKALCDSVLERRADTKLLVLAKRFRTACPSQFSPLSVRSLTIRLDETPPSLTASIDKALRRYCLITHLCIYGNRAAELDRTNYYAVDKFPAFYTALSSGLPKLERLKLVQVRQCEQLMSAIAKCTAPITELTIRSGVMNRHTALTPLVNWSRLSLLHKLSIGCIAGDPDTIAVLSKCTSLRRLDLDVHVWLDADDAKEAGTPASFRQKPVFIRRFLSDVAHTLAKACKDTLTTANIYPLKAGSLSLDNMDADMNYEEMMSTWYTAFPHLCEFACYTSSKQLDAFARNKFTQRTVDDLIAFVQRSPALKSVSTTRLIITRRNQSLLSGTMSYAPGAEYLPFTWGSRNDYTALDFTMVSKWLAAHPKLTILTALSRNAIAEGKQHQQCNITFSDVSQTNWAALSRAGMGSVQFDIEVPPSEAVTPFPLSRFAHVLRHGSLRIRRYYIPEAAAITTTTTATTTTTTDTSAGSGSGGSSGAETKKREVEVICTGFVIDDKTLEFVGQRGLELMAPGTLAITHAFLNKACETRMSRILLSRTDNPSARTLSIYNVAELPLAEIEAAFALEPHSSVEQVTTGLYAAEAKTRRTAWDLGLNDWVNSNKSCTRHLRMCVWSLPTRPLDGAPSQRPAPRLFVYYLEAVPATEPAFREGVDIKAIWIDGKVNQDAVAKDLQNQLTSQPGPPIDSAWGGPGADLARLLGQPE